MRWYYFKRVIYRLELERGEKEREGEKERGREREGGGCLHSEYWKWKPLRTGKMEKIEFWIGGEGGGLRWEEGELFVLIKFL